MVRKKKKRALHSVASTFTSISIYILTTLTLFPFFLSFISCFPTNPSVNPCIFFQSDTPPYPPPSSIYSAAFIAPLHPSAGQPEHLYIPKRKGKTPLPSASVNSFSTLNATGPLRSEHNNSYSNNNNSCRNINSNSNNKGPPLVVQLLHSHSHSYPQRAPPPSAPNSTQRPASFSSVLSSSPHPTATVTQSQPSSGMLGPGPGPAPTPSLTLPPLRELDKALGPESDHGRVPVHHTAPSGQPRSQSSDPHLHQHFHQQRSQQQQQSSYQSHDTVGRFAPSSGSIPDLYMSSPSAPPSTATSSSLSRADSISTMEYLQNNSHGHGHLHRGSASSGSSTSMSLGPNPANQNSHAESRPSTSAAATTASKTGTGVTAGAKDSNGSKSSAAEQGRNTSKRAAQNRAAQRAFRLRKDLYVRELERKAELLQAAESQLIALAARNRELETMFATLQLQMKQQPSSTSSPLPSPLPQQDGAMGPSGPLGRGEREWDRERDWARERPFESTGPFDHFHSSSMRPALGRHQSAQHLRQAYHASSPPLSNGSIKHLSLNSKMSSSFQRPDSDHEIEQGRPLRHLHRHPSESSLNLGRTGSYPAPTSESKEDDGPRIHNYRGTVDSRAEMSSPSPSNRSPLSGPHDSSMHHYPGSPLSPTHERMPLYTSNQNSRSTGANPSSHTSPNTGHGDPAFPPSSSSSSTYDLSKKRPSDGTVNWPGPDLYRTQDSHPHPYHHSVKKQSSWSSLSEQRRLHAIKKQPSWGSISEYRHQWRTKTESPEMTSADIRFGGSAPALPQIPPQFSQKQQQPPQRPTPPQQQHSFDREYPSSPAPFPYSPTVSHAHPPSQQQPSQHSRQSSDYYGHSRGSQDNPHGLSDMDIVQEGVPTSNGNGSYGRQGGYEGDHYESEREDRYTRAEQQPHVGTV